MKQNYDFKRGDVVGFIFAQPGNDTTYLLLLGVDHEKDTATAWDLGFEMEVDLQLARIWKASERELDSGLWKNSVVKTQRQMADEARAKFGIS